MENIQEFAVRIADFISEELESIDSGKNYIINPQFGFYKYTPKGGRIHKKGNINISGVLLTRSNAIVPIHDYDLFTLPSFLTLKVPQLIAQDVFNAVSQFVVNYNGTAFAVDDDNYAQFTFQTPTIENADQSQGAGTSAEIRLLFTAVYFGSAVIGNNIKLSLDGEQLSVLQAAVQVVKSYDSDNVGNDEYVRSCPTSQTVTITAKVAYRNTTELTKLVKNQLNGDLQQTYTISYVDGAAFTEEEPFEALFTATVTNSFAPGEIAALDIVFYKRGEIA